MLEIDVALDENFDETAEKFVVAKSVKVRLEHSLVSLSKWEAVWEETFLGKKEKTSEQTLSYVQMMVVDEELPEEVFNKLIERHLDEINKYILAPMSATKLPVSQDGSTSREPTTSELIYYWMISLNIPMECQRWHLNRLLTLIRVVNLKNTPKQKMTAKQRQELNRNRRQQYGTRG
jgi:hypothetical protein